MLGAEEEMVMVKRLEKWLGALMEVGTEAKIRKHLSGNDEPRFGS